MNLPANHPLRDLPDDFRLYQLVLEKVQAEAPGELDLLKWAYQTARELRIPTECVSKVLAAVRRYEK